MRALAIVARRAALIRMKGHAGLTALVPAANIHRTAPQSEPERPFIKLGRSNVTLLKASCLNGAVVTFPVHAFVRDRKNGSGAVVEVAEDFAGRIGGEIEAALDRKGEDVTVAGTPARLRYHLTDIQPDLVDEADSSAIHYFATVQARVVAA